MIGSLDGGRHYACGYTGNGVGPSQLVGRTLASLALERRDEPSRLPLIDAPGGPRPPEPLRYLGGTVVRRALVRRERLEERGAARRPSHPFRSRATGANGHPRRPLGSLAVCLRGANREIGLPRARALDQVALELPWKRLRRDSTRTASGLRGSGPTQPWLCGR